jgi:hypothetical protein
MRDRFLCPFQPSDGGIRHYYSRYGRKFPGEGACKADTARSKTTPRMKNARKAKGSFYIRQNKNSILFQPIVIAKNMLNEQKVINLTRTLLS